MSRFEWIKKFVTFLYNVVKNIMPIWKHPRNFMVEEVTKNDVQPDGAALDRGEGEDIVDFGLASDLKNSLEEVSKAIYKKFVSDWHTPPEELQNQPLYKEINSGIQNIFFNIKHKARPLEEYEIIISIASRFIAHFKNKRKKKATYSFKTRQEEVDFIRKHIKCLLDYWLPESMQRNQIIYVFITEILSVNVFESMINNFSDFTSINEAIVEAFDDNPATQQKEDSGKHYKIVHDSISDESHAIMESDDITSRKIQKKEKKGFRTKLKGAFKHMRPKRSETEAVAMFRSFSAVNDSVDTGSTDDSEDDENPMTSIIDNSLQMWIQNNWTAKVSEVRKKGLTEKEDEYKISVYDESSPGFVLWKTKRRVEDFEFMYTKICQKYPEFTNSTKPKTTGRPTDADGQFFHSIGLTPDEFIKILLNLLKKYQEREAVFFFSPFDYKDDDKQYLKCLPNTEEYLSEQSNTDDELTGDISSSEMESDCSGIQFRTFNPQNEEEKFNKVTDKTSSPTDLQGTDNAGSDSSKCKRDEFLLDSCDKESHSKEVYQADGLKFLRSRKKNKKYQSASRSEREDVPSTDVTGKEEFPSENADRGTNFFNIQPPIIMDSHPQKLSQNAIGLTSQGTSQTMEQRKKKLQKTLLDVLYQLTDEVLAGGNSAVWFLHKNGILKTFNKTILDFIPNMYAEEQVIWYLKQVAELLMSPVPPQQLPPDVLQSKALDILKNKVRGLLPCLLKYFLENWIMKNLTASYQALQDQLANKGTIYGILEDLTKIITDEGGMFNPLTVH